MIVHMLSGAHFISIPLILVSIIVSVTTSVTKALVMAPAIGASAPPDKTVPAVAPIAAPVATTVAFFMVVHPASPSTVTRVRCLLRQGVRIVSYGMLSR